MWLNHDKAWFRDSLPQRCVNSIFVCAVNRLRFKRRLLLILIKILLRAPPQSWFNFRKLGKTLKVSHDDLVCCLRYDSSNQWRFFLVIKIVSFANPLMILSDPLSVGVRCREMCHCLWSDQTSPRFSRFKVNFDHSAVI